MMAQQTELEITRRNVLGKATKHLRKSGIIPANISGHQEASLPVQIDATLFERARRTHGTRGIVLLRLPGAPLLTVLVRHVQHDAITGQVLHVDFSRVSLNERLPVKVPLRFVGTSSAVKNEGGVLLHLLDTLDVECLVSGIVEDIEVDISPLTGIDSVLYAQDVTLPANYTLITPGNEPVVKVAPSRTEAALEAISAESSTPSNTAQ